MASVWSGRHSGPEPVVLHEGALDIQIDPVEAERRKRARLVHLNTVEMPRVRVLGYALLVAAALLHNELILGDVAWGTWTKLIAVTMVYSVVSWYLLHLFYSDLRPYADLGAIFLGLDMWMYAFVIYATGAERSLIFFLPLFRVADQAPTSFRRALAFAHMAPLSYAAVTAYVLFVDHRPIPLGPEFAKVAFIYTGSLYIALIARSGSVRRDRSAAVIRLARSLIRELEEKSTALEHSTNRLNASFEQQELLIKDNARLFGETEAREARLSQILQSTSDGIIFVTPEGKVEAANLRAGDLLGFDPQNIIGVEVSRIFARLYSIGDGDAFSVRLKAVLADPSPGGNGDLQQPSTGRVFHWVAQPTRDATGGTVGLTFTFQDVTPTRDLVRQLEDNSRLLDEARRKAESANSAKGEFLANVTHEIRTPLSAIIGMAQLLLDATPSPEQAEMTRRIKTSAESLMAIIGDILDFSKIDSRKLTLEREPLALRAVLRDVLDSLQVTAAEKGLGLALDVLPEVPDALVGDPLRLRQVLLNLIGNALKFTERGEVRLRVGVASTLPSEVCLHFAVIDTGVGIPRDKQELVFEAFAQADGSAARKFGGTGLGLSIAARLVELMGGDIWVESEVGRGSVFRFTAMLALDVPGASPQAQPEEERTRRLTVLVAEDEQVHRELLAHLLVARGHRVITARNGREALIELGRHPIQLLLLDLQMPEMNGLQTAKAVRDWEAHHGGHLPLVAMTASVLAKDREACVAAGIDECLVKPISREHLYQAVEGLAADRQLPVAPPPEYAGRAQFLENLGNDLDLARKLIDLFLAESSPLMDEMSHAIADCDTERLQKAAHKLKGAVSNFPAGPARDAASRMELIGFDSDFQAAREVFPVLEREIERLRSLLPTLVTVSPESR